MSDNIELRPTRLEDLELMLAWRSDPEIYEHFREQQEPLNWEDHVNWFINRPPDRHDFIIEYRGRRVGSVNVDKKDYIGVYIGEKSLWGQGIATETIEHVCDILERAEFYAEIHIENTASQNLFEKCGFKKIGRVAKSSRVQ